MMLLPRYTSEEHAATALIVLICLLVDRHADAAYAAFRCRCCYAADTMLLPFSPCRCCCYDFLPILPPITLRRHTRRLPLCRRITLPRFDDAIVVTALSPITAAAAIFAMLLAFSFRYAAFADAPPADMPDTPY